MAEPEILKPGEVPGKDPVKRLEARVKALEDKKIGVPDLPLIALRREFQKEPQDPLQSLLLASVTMDLLAPDVLEELAGNAAPELANMSIDVGPVSVVWPGGGAISNETTVNHRLTRAPIFVHVNGTSAAPSAVMSCRPIAGSFTETEFKFKLTSSAEIGAQTTPSIYVAIG